MKLDIEHQKQIADDILSRLELIDPSCILAGGAPRDWYFNKPAADLDFFIHTRQDLQMSWIEKQIEGALGIGLKGAKSSDKGKPYAQNPYLKRVWEFEYKGQVCQLMEMTKPTFKSVLPEFALNLSKAWYKGRVVVSPEFQRGVKYKVLVKINPLYKDGDKYLAKIRKKFPDYTYYNNWEEASIAILDAEAV